MAASRYASAECSRRSSRTTSSSAPGTVRWRHRPRSPRMADGGLGRRRTGKGNMPTEILVDAFSSAVAGNAIALFMQTTRVAIASLEKIYLLLVGLVVVVFHARPANQAPSSQVGAAIIAAIFLVSLFSAALYPFVPQAFGGAADETFHLECWEPPPSFPKPISESVAARAAKPTLCRIVSLVFSSRRTTTIRRGETDEGGEPPRLKLSRATCLPIDAFVSKSRFCFIRSRPAKQNNSRFRALTAPLRLAAAADEELPAGQ